MIEINEAQLNSLSRKWNQDNQGMTFQQFKATAEKRYNLGSFDNHKGIMVKWRGYWLGIEEDGYTCWCY
tara:strand:+ start:722 stop:928 length:207 start_codon:yes stop_codon:yes gene_type:complete